MSAAVERVRKLYTEDDLWQLSGGGFRYELIEGELREMSPSGGEHGRSTKRLDHHLTDFIYERELGECFAAETGFTVGRDPDTTMAPDWAFVRGERLPDPLPPGFLRLAPDIVLETRSPRDTAEAKSGQWLGAGVRIVLDLDPLRRVLRVCRAGTEPETLEPGDELSLGDALPGFRLVLSGVFPRRR
jgi:Uma2 family endonuclease